MQPNVPPNAPPAASPAAYAENGLLVARRGSTLPPRCVYCNSPCDTPPQKTRLTKTPRMSVSIVGGVLGGAIGGLIGGLIDHAGGNGPITIMINVHVCDVHRRIKQIVIRNIILINAVAITLSFLIGYQLRDRGIIDFAAGPIFLGIFLGLLVTIFYALAIQKRAGFQLSLKNANAEYAFIKGAGKPFLDSLSALAP